MFLSMLFFFEAQQKLGGGFNDFLFSPPSLGFHDAIWRGHIFQMGWFNHQLEKITMQNGSGVDFPTFGRKDSPVT